MIGAARTKDFAGDVLCVMSPKTSGHTRQAAPDSSVAVVIRRTSTRSILPDASIGSSSTSTMTRGAWVRPRRRPTRSRSASGPRHPPRDDDGGDNLAPGGVRQAKDEAVADLSLIHI